MVMVFFLMMMMMMTIVVYHSCLQNFCRRLLHRSLRRRRRLRLQLSKVPAVAPEMVRPRALALVRHALQAHTVHQVHTDDLPLGTELDVALAAAGAGADGANGTVSVHPDLVAALTLHVEVRLAVRLELARAEEAVLAVDTLPGLWVKVQRYALAVAAVQGTALVVVAVSGCAEESL